MMVKDCIRYDLQHLHVMDTDGAFVTIRDSCLGSRE